FLERTIHGLGRQFIKLSEWYPGWWYIPRLRHFFIIKRDEEGSHLFICIKSSRINETAYLSLSDFRLEPIGRTHHTEEFVNQLREHLKRMGSRFNNEILGGQVIELEVIHKERGSNGLWRLMYRNNEGLPYATNAFYGKYNYAFTESGKHRGKDFNVE